MTMQKLEATSPQAQSANLLADNIAQLKALFPELVTEGANGAAINVDVLKALVGDATATDADEKYGLNWHGKRRARQLALTPSTGTLRPCPEESVDWDSTQNLMIEGDNLEVLKLLQKSYAGKVKLIYIDPPYNTGKDFVYPDNFQDNIKNYLELTGQLEGGSKISSNTESSGRFHTDWLNMMYPRLKLARNLLREDGLLFVNIDENESANVRHVLDDIFGSENLAGVIVWKKGSGSSETDFSYTHDQIVIYRKSEKAVLGRVAQGEQQLASYQNPDNDLRGDWTSSDYTSKWTKAERPNLWYSIKNPNSGLDCWPAEQRTWAYSADETLKNIQGNLLWWGKSGSNERPRYKRFKSVTEGLRVPRSWWDDVGTNENGSDAFRLLSFEKADFPHPKPVELLKEIIQIGAPTGGLIVDFFAGSGTTGQAVLEQATDTKLPLKFLLIQFPEQLEKSKFSTLFQVTRERIFRCAIKIRAANADVAFATGQLEFDPPPAEPAKPLDLGFRVFKLDNSNIRAWNPDRDNLAQTLLDHEEHILAGRTENDIMYELLLKLGLDLCVPMQSRSFSDKTVSAIGGGVLMTCLAEEILAGDVEALAQGIVAWHKELAPVGDTTCVFRDSAFENDVAKTNLAAILEQHGIQNVRSL